MVVPIDRRSLNANQSKWRLHNSIPMIRPLIDIVFVETLKKFPHCV